MTGDDFRQWRAQFKMTQRQAADLLGVNVGTVRTWEQGVREPPAHMAMLIERLGPADLPSEVGSDGNRPPGIATKHKSGKNGSPRPPRRK